MIDNTDATPVMVTNIDDDTMNADSLPEPPSCSWYATQMTLKVIGRLAVISRPKVPIIRRASCLMVCHSQS